MPSTLLLDTVTWDLTLDANGNIARADEPYSLAQDAASAIKTFRGEVFWNTLLGVPYLAKILGKNPPLSLLRAELESAAAGAEGVASARVFLAELSDRGLAGQVQVRSQATGRTAAASFIVVNPQVF